VADRIRTRSVWRWWLSSWLSRRSWLAAIPLHGVLVADRIRSRSVWRLSRSWLLRYSPWPSRSSGCVIVVYKRVCLYAVVARCPFVLDSPLQSVDGCRMVGFPGGCGFLANDLGHLKLVKLGMYFQVARVCEALQSRPCDQGTTSNVKSPA
jgi:hypothetical protein